MRELILYEDYSRKEVHDVFDPDSKFTPQAGTWGLQGIIEIPERAGDYVFFVTYGQRQATHEFDEGITAEGVLRWQSQPKQRLSDPTIRKLIAHDEEQHSIYLFLRTAARQPYTYLGCLKYLTHDHDRERPVYFAWQILDWLLPEQVRVRMNLTYEHPIPQAPESTPSPGLILVDAPTPSVGRRGVSTKTYKSSSPRDYAKEDARNRALGLAGEESVLERERQTLIAVGRSDLAERILHVAKIEGDGAGYDIKSYTPEGEEKFIEVKTTRGDNRSGFYLSAAEIRFSDEHLDRYYLYRVFDFDPGTCSGKLFIQKGRITTAFSLEAVQFKASIKST
jgi:hypothetical protein